MAGITPEMIAAWRRQAEAAPASGVIAVPVGTFLAILAKLQED